MKRSIILILISFLAVNLYGQSETFQVAKKNTIGMHVVPLQSHILPIDGFSHYLFAHTLGIDYSREFSNRWSFFTGIEQERNSKYKNWIGDYTPLRKFFLVGIPVAIKYNFSIPVFLKFGAISNFFAYSVLNNNEYLFFLRWQLSAGWEHEFNNGFLISISQEIRWSGKMDSKTLNEYFKNGYRSYGINVGIGYKF